MKWHLRDTGIGPGRTCGSAGKLPLCRRGAVFGVLLESIVFRNTSEDMNSYPDPDEIHELQKRLDAIPRETREVICCNCLKEYVAEVFQGERVFRCPSCVAKRLAAMNN